MKKGFIAEAGFTLIELLVVISIIGILIALSVFGLQGARTAARDARRKADLEQIRSGLEIYKADCNSYPNSLGAALVGPQNGPAGCVGNSYITEVPIDPVTGAAYAYSTPDSGVTYQLCATLEQTGAAYCVKNP